jgi:hypothetical protein
MMISAYGMMLLFTVNQPTGLTLIPYPPFGLTSICFMVLATYLVFLGVYSSATSVSEDSRLRQTIRKIALRESQFLDAIGTAQMEQELQRRVIAIYGNTKNSMLNETGISSSVDENDEVLSSRDIRSQSAKEKKEGIGNQVFCQYLSMLITGKFLQI